MAVPQDEAAAAMPSPAAAEVEGANSSWPELAAAAHSEGHLTKTHGRRAWQVAPDLRCQKEWKRDVAGCS